MDVNHDDPPPVVLNAPLIRALLLGAGMRYDRELAEAIGVSTTRLSRAMSGESAPSVRMLDGIARRWPNVPYERLVVPAGHVPPPADVGLTVEDMVDMANGDG
jgi:transcriptional regulator with XRE-family HTH domain